jgi:ABC-type glycerol-3-phosphate transport system substrate-binding protein
MAPFTPKKVLALVLAALTVLPWAAGCAGEAGETADSVTEYAETAEETASLYLSDELPENLSFDGAQIVTFGWSGPSNAEFFVEEQNGEIVNDSIFKRNRTVEERLDITLEYNLVAGAYEARNTWVTAISSWIMAGDAAYDISAGYSMSGATLAYKRLLIDLNALDYIDFDKPWWPSSLTDESTVAGRLYFCSGDISTYMLYYMYAVFFNKDILEKYNLDDPYEYVTGGKWTLDKLFEMSSAAYEDLNGNSQKDIEDRFGFSTHNTYVDAFFFGSGLRTTSKDEEGIPVISGQFGSEKTQELVTKLVDFFDTDYAYRSEDYTELLDIFVGGRALFVQNQVQLAGDSLRSSEIEYGILPIAKYNEAQSEYYTVMSFPYSLYGVPIDAREPNMSAAVLECLASESYRTVSPALFETAMKVKYSSDNAASAMYDIIRGSVVFDIGRIFNDSMNALTYGMFRSAVSGRNKNWISTYTSNEKTLNRLFDGVISALIEE